MRVSWTPLGRGTSHLIGSEQGESGPMPCSTRRPPSALPLPTHCEKAAEPRWNAQEWGPPARVREPGSVTAGEFAGESAVEVGTRVVQADDLHVLATLGVLRPDGVQRGDGGGVPDVGGGQVDDDLVGVACVVEPADEVVGGGEEQLAGDGVDDAGDDRERDRSGISASATTRPASTSVRQTFGSVSQSGRRPRSREAWDRAGEGKGAGTCRISGTPLGGPGRAGTARAGRERRPAGGPRRRAGSLRRGQRPGQADALARFRGEVSRRAGSGTGHHGHAHALSCENQVFGGGVFGRVSTFEQAAAERVADLRKQLGRAEEFAATLRARLDQREGHLPSHREPRRGRSPVPDARHPQHLTPHGGTGNPAL